MKSIAFFNNKGGVGKTTLACNAASYLADVHGQRVVVVDCDPQANATQLLLSDDTWESIYEDRQMSLERTVLKCLSHVRAGDSTLDTGYALTNSPRFLVDVLPGHPSLSAVEDIFSSSWVEFQAGNLGGARRSLWARSLVTSLTDRADIVIFDLGPSLGALNRSVLLGADYFLTPVAADLFSLYALENIGDWMRSWIEEYHESIPKVVRMNGEVTEKYKIPQSVTLSEGYLGYTVQQYIAKSTAGRIRNVAAYDRYRAQIPDRAANLKGLQARTAAKLDLGVVPNMFSMVPLAQTVHAPIARLKSSDGVRGAQTKQQERYAVQLGVIFDSVAANLGLKEVS